MQKQWFTLSKATTSKLTYEQFASSLADKMRKYGEWTLCMDKLKFDAIMTSSTNTNKNYYHPLIVFHGTSTQDVVNSILKYGHVLPGEILLSTGEPVNMRIGKMYGPGTYTTTDIETAKSYGYYDLNMMMRIIVNIVITENIENVYPFSVKYKPNVTIATYDSKKLLKTNEPLSYDATYIHGPEILVIRDPINVIPIGTITIRDKINRINCYSDRLNYLNSKDEVDIIEFKKVFESDKNNYWVSPFIPRDNSMNQSNKQSFDQLFNSNPTKQRNHLLIPSHILRNRIIKESLQNYINTLEMPRVTVFDHNKWYNVEGKIRDLQNFTSKFKYSSLSDDLSKCLDEWFQKVINDVSCFVVIFFDHKYKGNSIKEICNNLKTKNRQDLSLCLRTVYIDVDYKSPIIHDTYNLQLLDNTNSYYDNFLLQATVSESSRPNQGFESDILKYASTSKLPLHLILNALREQQNNQEYLKNAMHVCVPFPYGECGSGFVNSLDMLPSWDTCSTYPLLWKGNLPKYLRINGTYYKVWTTDITELKEKPKKSYTRPTKNKFLPKIKEREKIPMTEKDKVELFMKAIRPILGMFRNRIIIDPHLYKQYAVLFDNFLGKCTTLLDNYIQTTSDNISLIKDLYHYITNLHSEMDLYGNMKGDALKGKFFARMKGLHFCKKILKRVKNNKEITIDAMANTDVVSYKSDFPKDVDSLFGNSNFASLEGFACKIINSNASEIDPWLIIVNDVLNTKLTIKDIYLSKELGVPFNGNNQSFNGIIIPNQITKQTKNNSELIRGFIAYQYTGLPFLSIKSQKLALLTNGCCAILERILLNVKLQKAKEKSAKTKEATETKEKKETKETKDTKGIKDTKSDDVSIDYIKKQLELFEYLAEGLSFNDKYDSLYEELVKNPVTVLTDTQKIQSLTKVIGILLKRRNTITLPNESKTQLYRFLFMESLRRTINSQMKTSKMKEYDVIDLVTKQTKVVGRNTNVFFQNRFIAATPFAIVACLGYLDCKDKGFTLDDIAKKFMTYSISVMEFFKEYFPDMIAPYLSSNNNIGKLQISLILRCLNGLNEKMFDDDDDTIIERANTKLQEHKKNIEKLLSIKSSKVDKNKEKMKSKLDKYILNNQYCIAAHNKIPKVFTKDEVLKLNLERKNNKQYKDSLELMKNGLLKHHCCFPECPEYLGKSFATENDIKNDKRHGLFSHMRINIVQGQYYKNVHNHAYNISKNGYSYEEFEKVILNHIKQYYSRQICGNTHMIPVSEDSLINDATYVCKELWKSYNNKNP
jgi:hypothetical protein